MLIALACVAYLTTSASQFLPPAMHTTSALFRIHRLRLGHRRYYYSGLPFGGPTFST